MEAQYVSDDLFGRALWDFHHHQFVPPLRLHNTYGKPENWDVEGFFYDPEDFSEMEEFALSLGKGEILDVGAAAGRHALFLQEKHDLDVHALDISRYCCDVMLYRGVKQVICEDIFQYKGTGFDTIIMLMNGIGLCGTQTGLYKLLLQLKSVLKVGGQIIFDSSDVAYLLENENWNPTRYYGELKFRFEYKHLLGQWIEWLYIDQKKMATIARSCGWKMQIVYEDETGNYLARLS